MENKEKYFEKLLIEYIKHHASSYDLQKTEIKTISDAIELFYHKEIMDFFIKLIFDCDIEIEDAIEITKKAQEEYKNEHENV